jgi:hypothetical protein
VDSTFELAGAADAQEVLNNNHVRGKVVLKCVWLKHDDQTKRGETS